MNRRVRDASQHHESDSRPHPRQGRVRGALQTTSVEVLIVGAGPTGLWLAIWLTKLGVRVRIIDRAAAPGTTSRALAVHARTMEFGDQVGVADAMAAAGVRIEALNIWVGGRRAARVPIRDIGEGFSPYPFPLFLPQDVHERQLIDRLRDLGVTVERSTALTSVTQDAQCVRAELTRDGVSEIVEVSYLAGCDGASSTVRDQLGIGFPGGTYTGAYYVADVDASGPAVDKGVHIDLENVDFAIVFPLKAAGRVRLIGVIRDLADSSGDLTFEDVRGNAIAHLQLDVTAVHWFSTYRVHHRVAERFRSGRAFLLGDAAHIHSPVGGQGMNTGIGDAVNLSWKLAAVLRRRAGESLLETYEPERIAFARRLVATTDRVFTVVSAPGGFARIVRTKLVPVIAPYVTRIAALRRFIFRIISQIRIEYRHSALSEGEAGSVHGGDRLPWVELPSGATNFAPLASLDWQVHVYGGARRDLADACSQLGLALHCFGWTAKMAAAGFERDALYLIRPDGYVAWADPGAAVDRLHRYLRDRSISAK
ncbi:MAG: FAD-dependent monooxygenase [Cyanobacteria bacterium]|nr:FAD-dependent monooxygenase [Cyanobacteriota bacterium]